MKKINIYISDIQRKRLEIESRKSGINKSELIRRAIDKTYKGDKK